MAEIITYINRQLKASSITLLTVSDSERTTDTQDLRKKIGCDIMVKKRKSASFQVSKMFRWLKDKKKPRRPGDKEKSAEDDYGFRKNSTRLPTDALPEFLTDYGFKNTTCLRIPTDNVVGSVDPTYHIYEEILDLPAEDNRNLQTQNLCSKVNNSNSWSSISLHNGSNLITADGQLQNCSNVGSAEGSVTRRSNVNSREGPYMVVPIVCKTENETSCTECSRDKSLVSDRFTCTCKCRKQLQKVESNYSEPWDSSESSCSTRFVSRKNTTLLNNSNPKTKRHDSTRSYVTSSSSECSSSSAKSSSASRSSGPDVDGNDTCCEYDMSTSSESDFTEEYKSYLDKVQQNLILTEKVRNIIHSLSNSGNLTSEDSSNTLERSSDVESVRTVSSLSDRSSQPTLSTGEVSDPDVPADQSESDDSSGYYECSEEKNLNSCSEDGAYKMFSTEVETKRRSSNQYKSKSHKVKHKKITGEQVERAIMEDTEMYLLPTSKKGSECDDVRVYRKPLLLPPQQTLIYQDPNRSKTRSSNRLLCDLIRMNYDKQHMIRV